MSAPRSVRLSMRNGGRSWTGCAQWSVVRVDNNREQQTRGVSAAALEARSTGTGASTRLSAAGGGIKGVESCASLGLRAQSRSGQSRGVEATQRGRGRGRYGSQRSNDGRTRARGEGLAHNAAKRSLSWPAAARSIYS